MAKSQVMKIKGGKAQTQVKRVAIKKQKGKVSSLTKANAIDSPTVKGGRKLPCRNA
jgi:hypothetical protein